MFCIREIEKICFGFWVKLFYIKSVNMFCFMYNGYSGIKFGKVFNVYKRKNNN